MKKVILITGGAGYIGSNLVHLFKELNIDYLILDKLKSDDPNSVQLDMTEYKSPDQLPSGIKVKGIIHLAAYKDLNESYQKPYKYYSNNLNCTLKCMEMARDLKAEFIIHSSTAAVYPEHITRNCVEFDVSEPPSPYANSKYVSERILNEACEVEGIKCINLRYQNPIGGYTKDLLDLSDSMFGNVVNSITNKTTFTIYGGDYESEDGTCIRDYVDMRDLCELHIKIIRFINSNQPCPDVFNIGTGIPQSCLSICETVKKLVPDFQYQIGDRREGDALGSYADISRLQTFVNHQFRTSEESIKYLLNLINN